MPQPASAPRLAQTAPPSTRTPRNQAELQALALNRSELKAQLESITRRREELAEQSVNADAATSRDLQGRMKALDDRSARLEQQILQADEAIAEALARGVATQEMPVTVVPPPPFPPFPSSPTRGVERPGFLFGMALILALLGVFIYRWGWRRAKKKFAGVTSGDAARLEQLQQAVDVIAVEVERISEGQRYVSKVLNERQPSLAAAEAERVPVPRGSSEGARKGAR